MTTMMGYFKMHSNEYFLAAKRLEMCDACTTSIGPILSDVRTGRKGESSTLNLSLFLLSDYLQPSISHTHKHFLSLSLHTNDYLQASSLTPINFFFLSHTHKHTFNVINTTELSFSLSLTFSCT